jgi:hypothetical protein
MLQPLREGGGYHEGRNQDPTVLLPKGTIGRNQVLQLLYHLLHVNTGAPGSKGSALIRAHRVSDIAQNV